MEYKYKLDKYLRDKYYETTINSGINFLCSNEVPRTSRIFCPKIAMSSQF